MSGTAPAWRLCSWAGRTRTGHSRSSWRRSKLRPSPWRPAPPPATETTKPILIVQRWPNWTTSQLPQMITTTRRSTQKQRRRTAFWFQFRFQIARTPRRRHCRNKSGMVSRPEIHGGLRSRRRRRRCAMIQAATRTRRRPERVALTRRCRSSRSWPWRRRSRGAPRGGRTSTPSRCRTRSSG
uniref:Uncharacterized protein n=1 Tax=Arundo donax TaxID=35708 RepID=A0A0A9H0G2_ARUDO